MERQTDRDRGREYLENRQRFNDSRSDREISAHDRQTDRQTRCCPPSNRCRYMRPQPKREQTVPSRTFTVWAKINGCERLQRDFYSAGSFPSQDFIPPVIVGRSHGTVSSVADSQNVAVNKDKCRRRQQQWRPLSVASRLSGGGICSQSQA